MYPRVTLWNQKELISFRKQKLNAAKKVLEGKTYEFLCAINELLDKLSHLKVEDHDKIGELSGEIRRAIEGIAIPEDIIETVCQRERKVP